MRIHLHDHSGHVFTAHLARVLARRGHEVDYGYSAQFESPHGRFEVDADDDPKLRIRAVSAAVPFDKYSPVRRVRYELSYATAWQRALAGESPDVVVACGVPLFTMARMRRWFAARSMPWVLWHQDVYSHAVADEADRVLPGPVAARARRVLTGLERRQVGTADAVLAIDEAFVEQYGDWGIRADHVTVLGNWAPAEEIEAAPRDNAWTRRHGLPPDALRLLYAGTLGRKHDPALLVRLLDALQARGVPAHLTVVSEGPAAAELAESTRGRDDVLFLPFQPAEELGRTLSGADVCVALLEPAAARFSVPSKVLSYLVAGRPTLALVPDSNAAARTVTAAGGLAIAPDDAGVAAAADWAAALWRDPAALAAVGRAARAHAERSFDIERIAGTFEDVVRRATTRSAGARGADPLRRVAGRTPRRGYSHVPSSGVRSPGEGE